MGDVRLTCPGCGKEIAVSEFIASETICCSQCGSNINVLRNSAEPELTVLKPSPAPVHVPTLPTEDGRLPAEVSDSGAGSNRKIAYDQKHAGRKRELAVPSQWERSALPLFMLLTGGLLVGLQYATASNKDMFLWYMGATYGLTALVFLATVIKAFFDKIVYGLALLCIPFVEWGAMMLALKEVNLTTFIAFTIAMILWLYLPFYIFFGLKKSPMLKGAFAGLLLAAFAEHRIIEQVSLGVQIFNEFIQVSKSMM